MINLLKTQKTGLFNSLLLLRFICFCIFLGRGWQHIFRDIPIRTILWNQDIMKDFVEGYLNISWYEWGTSLTVDFYINLFVKSVGFMYLLIAVVSLIIQHHHKKAGLLLPLGVIMLLMLAILNTLDDNLMGGQFIEHACQIIAPIILYAVIFEKLSEDKLNFLIKFSIAFTFAGHGLYAMGVHRVPANFVDMTINILHLSEQHARLFLYYIGIADIIISITIFIPSLTKVSLMYCIIWGLITAWARIFGNMNYDLFWYCLNQSWFETSYRLVHGLLPLYLYLSARKLTITSVKLIYKKAELKGTIT
ncbi:MAG: hypothetical protein ACK40G_12275 [Cytophagaceae bacterium]